MCTKEELMFYQMSPLLHLETFKSYYTNWMDKTTTLKPHLEE